MKKMNARKIQALMLAGGLPKNDAFMEAIYYCSSPRKKKEVISIVTRKKRTTAMGYCLGKDPYITTFLLKREKSCGFWDCADKEVKFSQIEISRSRPGSRPGESCCTIWSQVGTYAGKFMQVIAIEIFRTGNTLLDVFVVSEVDGKDFKVTSETYAQEVDVAVVLEDGEHPFTLHRAVVQ